MTDIVIAIPSDLALPVALLLLVLALGWLGLKAHRLPRQMADGFANGLARFAKVGKNDENYAEHYAQLSSAIFEAWDNKDPVALLPLVANPIVIKAWNNLSPAVRGFMQRGGAKESEAAESYA